VPFRRPTTPCLYQYPVLPYPTHLSFSFFQNTSLSQPLPCRESQGQRNLWPPSSSTFLRHLHIVTILPTPAPLSLLPFTMACRRLGIHLRRRNTYVLLAIGRSPPVDTSHATPASTLARGTTSVRSPVARRAVLAKTTSNNSESLSRDFWFHVLFSCCHSSDR
jgi:hypothetical protein